MVRSCQKRLNDVRRPRVHITYDVETGGAPEERDLPFSVGVLSDLAGDSPQPLRPLKERKFVQIDRDNFDEVLASIRPGVEFKVENTLQGDGSEMPVRLSFRSMEDFEPDSIVRQVEPLRKLLATREKLRALLAKVDLSEDLENILEQVLQDSDTLETFSTELGLDPSVGR